MESKIAIEAAEWLFRLDEDTGAECRREFVAWLKSSSRHMEEFLLVSATAAAARGLDANKTIDVDALLKESLENVVTLHEAQAPSPIGAREPRAGRKHWASFGVAAAVCGAIALATLYRFDDGHYSTAVGEQRSFQLEDGSLLHLNTHSQVQVKYSKRGRDIDLVQGEALFVVAQDRSRPFRVTAGTALIQAVGTQFNVFRHMHGATVSVLEGRVRVANVDKKPILGAGEQIEITDDGHALNPKMADIDATMAWRQRRLVFRSQRLDEIAAEFNRYNHATIHIEGAAAAKQMSGTFNANQPEAFLGFLRNDPKLAVIDTHHDTVVKPKDPAP